MLYNKILQNAIYNDFENFRQQILRILISIWEFIVLPIALFLIVWIVLKVIAAIGTFVSKIIQPICTLASEGFKAICTLASQVLKYACILMPVMLVTLSFVLVVLVSINCWVF